MTKRNLGRQGKPYFILQDSPSSEETKAKTQGRNLEARSAAEAMEKWCLLACSHGFLSLPSYTTPPPKNKNKNKTKQPRYGTTHSELDPSRKYPRNPRKYPSWTSRKYPHKIAFRPIL
jgi:hypothetical protein